MMVKPPRPLSIYVHWPFCLSKCPYCDFNSHVESSVNHEEWLKAYETELDYFAKSDYFKSSAVEIKTIFFGGGTPSLMSPKVVAGIIDKIAELWHLDEAVEITLEANPTSFEAEKFSCFKSAGIERVSIGVQSLNDKDLVALGRGHSSSSAKEAIKQASSIFERLSFDLIYARSGQSLDSWQTELEEAMSLAKGHISLYQLTIEKGTPFYKAHREGQLVLPDAEAAADMYDWTNNYLREKGYERYEISNYSIPGQECRHNLAYWHYDEYLGIGPGAHSRLRYPSRPLAKLASGSGALGNSGAQNRSILKVREDLSTKLTQPFIAEVEFRKRSMAFMMWHKPAKWLQSVSELGHGIQTSEALSQQELIEEVLMMGLRLKEGVSLERFKHITGLNLLDAINQVNADHYVSSGFIEPVDDYLKLTAKGLLVHNYLVARLL